MFWLNGARGFSQGQLYVCNGMHELHEKIMKKKHVPVYRTHAT